MYPGHVFDVRYCLVLLRFEMGSRGERQAMRERVGICNGQYSLSQDSELRFGIPSCYTPALESHINSPFLKKTHVVLSDRNKVLVKHTVMCMHFSKSGINKEKSCIKFLF